VGREAEQRIRDLEQELQFTKENLQATIEELETSNEELQATNEELLASNEELQSTNEELQSVNEELYTVNAEYQSKIIELTELNNDMDNLLDSTDIGTLFLDEDLEIRKFTPKIRELYKIREGDIGRPIGHLNHRLVELNPVEVFDKVHTSGQPLEREMQSEEGRWYLMRCIPYKIGPSAFSGIVATFIEISGVKQAQKDLLASEEDLRQERDLVARIMETSPACITMVDRSGQIVYANARAERLFGLERSGIQKRTFNAPEWKITDYEGNPFPEEQLPFVRVRETGEPVRSVAHAIEHPNGRRILLSIHAAPLLDENGVFDGMVSIVEDVTAQIAVQQQADRSEARYRELFERMHSGFALHEIITDASGTPVDYRFLEVNPAFEEMTGLSRSMILGKRVTQVIPGIHHSESDWIGKYGRVALTGEPIRFENHSKELGRWFAVTAYRPSPNHFATIFDDITSRKEK
jgi:two-component system CheB/CheR fusion protein